MRTRAPTKKTDHGQMIATSRRQGQGRSGNGGAAVSPSMAATSPAERDCNTENATKCAVEATDRQKWRFAAIIPAMSRRARPLAKIRAGTREPMQKIFAAMQQFLLY